MQAQGSKASASRVMAPTAIVSDAYSTMLNRNPTAEESQYWKTRLSTLSPVAVIDLYDGLARLPDFKKRFAGLTPQDQVKLLYRTLLRVNSPDATGLAHWQQYFSKKGLTDTIESMMASSDHTMTVYKTVGLSTQQEVDAVHIANETALKDRPKAAALFTAIINKGTKVPEVYYYLAKVHEATNLKQATEPLQQGLTREPEFTLGALKLADILMNLGVQGKSFERGTRAIRASDARIGADPMILDMNERLNKSKHPEFLSRDVLILRGLAHAHGDQWESAIAEYDRALALGEGDGTVYGHRGDALFNVRRYEESIKDLNLSTKNFGNSITVQWSRALAYIQVGKYKEALPDLDSLLKITPNPKLIAARAKCYEKLGRTKEQIADLTKQISLDPHTIKPLLERGRAYMGLGKYKEAITDLTKAAKLRPKFRETYRLRAECFMKLNNKTAAEQDRKTVEQLSRAVY